MLFPFQQPVEQDDLEDRQRHLREIRKVTKCPELLDPKAHRCVQMEALTSVLPHGLSGGCHSVPAPLLVLHCPPLCTTSPSSGGLTDRRLLGQCPRPCPYQRHSKCTAGPHLRVKDVWNETETEARMHTVHKGMARGWDTD